MQIKKYSLHFGKRILAKNLDVILAEDKINIISGGNGVGKTTFLDFLAGVGPRQRLEKKLVFLPNAILLTNFRTYIFFQH